MIEARWLTLYVILRDIVQPALGRRGDDDVGHRHGGTGGEQWAALLIDACLQSNRASK